MPWRRAEDRCLIRLQGGEAVDFLQDLVTNDVAPISEERAVYAALLTPQGKYLADFFVFRLDGAVALDASAAQAESLARRLSMYKLRREIAISLDPETPIRLVWPAPGGAAPGPAPKTGGAALPDPRDPRLGWRVVGGGDPAGAPDDAGYEALRLSLAVPDSARDLIANDSYILEAGFERLNGVAFRKGCYIGQEVVARMKHKTALRKGLVRVRLEGAAPPGAPLTTADDKPAGVLLSHAGGIGLAHVRYDRAEGAMRAGETAVATVLEPPP